VVYWFTDRKELEKRAFEKNGRAGVRNIKRMYQTMKKLPDKVKFQPIDLQIEPTNACNLGCTMCSRTLYMKRDIKGVGLEELKKIVEQFPFLLKIHLQGLGEPFLNKNFFDMVSYLKSKKINVSTTTNASLITEGVLARIPDSGIDYISVSVDGGTQETYENIRKYSNFNRFKENLKKLISLREKGIRIEINTVILKENLEELPKVIELIHELGQVDSITFTDYADNTYEHSHHENNAFLVEDSPRKKEIINQLKNLAEKYNLTIYFLLKKDNTSLRESCFWPWLSCYINSDGSITTCTWILDYSLGNIFDEKFKDIWNSEKYQEFRKKLKSNNLYHRCVGCNVL
jgi:radical SAM protein with 4Fe4S-binding SPASM domain